MTTKILNNNWYNFVSNARKKNSIIRTNIWFCKWHVN